MSNHSRDIPRVKYQNSLINRLEDEFSIFDEIITPFSKFIKYTVDNSEIDKLYGVNFFDKSSYPKMDVIKNDEKIFIYVDVPGLNKNDISINLVERDEQDQVLSLYPELTKLIITTNTRNLYDSSKVSLLYKELKCSKAIRSIYLNNKEIITTSLVAAYENGMLKLELDLKSNHEKKPSFVSKQIDINE